MIAEVAPAERDPRALAAYTYSQAGRMLDIPASTIRAWKKGQDGFQAPIPTRLGRGLSYYDLVEVYVLRSLRTKEGFRLGYVRDALALAKKEFKIDRLLLHEEFRHDGHEFFLERYGELASLSPHRQMAIKGTLKQYLRRIEYSPDQLAAKLYLVTKNTGLDGPRRLVCNPLVAFGAPVVARRGIRTAAIVARVNAGEEPEHIIRDYGLELEEFEEALYFEAA